QPERVGRTQRGRREGHRQAHQPGDHRRQGRVQPPETPAGTAGTVPGGFRVADERLGLSANFLHDSIRGNAYPDFTRRRVQWRYFSTSTDRPAQMLHGIADDEVRDKSRRGPDEGKALALLLTSGRG